ncbi:MAG: TIGR00270 family protein [Candidatus Aenigmarchaeota archaeon]|nr:TIGR00270 family protein [Candidatus Aenigmarchaeota archaeon]
MECELCGREAVRRALIEETVLRVCERCSTLGTAVAEQPPQKPAAPLPEKPPEELVLHPQFAQLVKGAREQRGLTRQQLATQLNEKLSAIERVERGMRPDKQLARKLERALGIRMLGYEAKAPPALHQKQPDITLGDVADVKVKKQRKLG